MAIKKAKIFTITSVKGGTGKTNLTLMLAGILEKLQLKTLIIDLDLYASGIAISLNIDNDKDIYKLAGDIRNNRYEAFEDYTVKYDEFIDVLPAPKDPRFASKIGVKYIDMVLNKASTRYDVILVDTNHLLTDNNLVTLDYSDNIIYLITNDLIDLKNMRTMLSIYNDMEKENYTIILNKAINKKGNFSDYEIEHMIDNNIDYVIYEDMYLKDLDSYLLNGQIVTLNKKIIKKANKTYKELERMLQKLLEG